MTPSEDFESLINRLDAELAAEMARQKKFLEALEKALIELSIQHFPETEPYKQFFIEELTQKANERAVMVNETIDLLVAGYSCDQFVFFGRNQVPERDVSQDEKLYLEEILKTLPAEQHDFFIQENAERVAIEAQDREFVFLCYDKTKELMVEFYPEIIDFSSHSLRNIDCTAYFEMEEWACNFYYCAADYINDYDLG